jgi:toxin ParE1/3/4
MIGEFLAEARDELYEAALYYESRQTGLGLRFREEVAFVVRRIAFNPYAWSEREGGYRRVNCPVFPYYLAYIIRGENLVIVAVAHARRKPGYWKTRMKG